VPICAGVHAWQAALFPGIPAGHITTMTNPNTVIGIFTPQAGFTFTGSISAGGYALTVNSGSTPAANQVINGPGIPSGDAVLSVAGSVLTLQWPATATETAQAFGVGAENPDGTYNGALFPRDNAGHAAWNDGSVWNPAAAHTQAVWPIP
jgi:hypothetical protein